MVKKDMALPPPKTKAGAILRAVINPGATIRQAVTQAQAAKAAKTTTTPTPVSTPSKAPLPSKANNIINMATKIASAPTPAKAITSITRSIISTGGITSPKSSGSSSSPRPTPTPTTTNVQQSQMNIDRMGTTTPTPVANLNAKVQQSQPLYMNIDKMGANAPVLTMEEKRGKLKSNEVGTVDSINLAQRAIQIDSTQRSEIQKINQEAQRKQVKSTIFPTAFRTATTSMADAILPGTGGLMRNIEAFESLPDQANPLTAQQIDRMKEQRRT